MDYNTQRDELKLPEYGRNVHKMVHHAVTISDREERNRAAETIVEVMKRVNPNGNKQSNNDEVYHKLWDHLFIISNFELDVDAPYPKPNPETFEERPERVPYPKKNFRFDQYGKTIELMIEKAKSLPEGEVRDELALAIANLMKRAYLQWNRDTVQDDLITEHLSQLSNGELTLKDPSRLSPASELAPQQSSGGGKKKKRKNNRGRKRKNQG